ncbi:MAG: ComEC/Rec2 family competence protein [Marinilabiliaceae bacterium]
MYATHFLSPVKSPSPPRLLALAALSLLAGELLGGGSLPSLPWVALLVAFAALALLSLWGYGRWRSPMCEWIVRVAATLFFVSAGGLLASQSRVDFIMSRDRCQLSGLVTSVERSDSLSVRLVVSVDSLSSPSFKASGILAMVTAPRSALSMTSGPLSGGRVCARGVTSVPYPDPLSDFDYLAYLTGRGVSAMVVADSVTLRPAEGFSLAALAGEVNERFSSVLAASGVSEANVDFLRALVLADRSSLPPSVRRDFSACGTSHVLAVSGLHVGVLSFGVAWLLSFFVRRPVASALSLPLVWLYVILAGASPSIVRAAVMFSFLSVEMSLGRRLPSFHSLWAALFAILLFDPLSAGSTSLWLSFLAVGGLLAVIPRFEPWLKVQRRLVKFLVGGLVVSVVAQIATLPVLLYEFHSVPIYFGLNNLIVVEPIKWVFILALLCPLASLVPPLGFAVGWCADSLLSFVTSYCHWAASLPLATVDSIPCGEGLFVALLAAVCAALLAFRRPVRRRLAFLAASLTVLAGVASFNFGGRASAMAIPFSSRGVAGVVVSDGGGGAVFFADAADEAAAAGVARAMASRCGWDSCSVDCGSALCVAEINGMRYAIVNSARVDSVPPCDVCIVNCNILTPLKGAREFVFTENCETALLLSEYDKFVARD